MSKTRTRTVPGALYTVWQSPSVLRTDVEFSDDGRSRPDVHHNLTFGQLVLLVASELTGRGIEWSLVLYTFNGNPGLGWVHNDYLLWPEV